MFGGRVDIAGVLSLRREDGGTGAYWRRLVPYGDVAIYRRRHSLYVTAIVEVWELGEGEIEELKEENKQSDAER